MKPSLIICVLLVLLLGATAWAQDPNDPALNPDAQHIVFDLNDQPPGDVSAGLVLTDPAHGFTILIERSGAPMELVDIGPAFGGTVLSPFGDPGGQSIRISVLDMGNFNGDPGPFGLGWGLAKIQLTLADFVPSDTDGYYASYTAVRDPFDPAQSYVRNFESTLSGDQTMMAPGFWSVTRSWWAAYPISEFFILAGSPDEPNSVFYDNITLTITPRNPNLPYQLPGGAFDYPDFIGPFPFFEPNPVEDDLGRLAVSDAPESDAGGGGQYQAANGPTGGSAAWIPLILLRDMVAAETDLHHGTQNALLAKLDSALGALLAGNVKTAMNTLGAFMNLVEAQSGKKIPVDLALLWIAQAQGVINLMAPSCTNCGNNGGGGGSAAQSASGGGTSGETQAAGASSSSEQSVGGGSSGESATGGGSGSASGGSSGSGSSGGSGSSSGSGGTTLGGGSSGSGGSDLDDAQGTAGASESGTKPQGDENKGKGNDSKAPGGKIK